MNLEERSLTIEEVAKLFHDTYEKLAPDFGYHTRPEYRDWNINSNNAKLMMAVCEIVLAEILRRDKEKDERIQFIWQWFEHYKVRAETAEAEAEAYIKPLIAQYNAEQERIRQEEEARLREEARKQEEERILREAAEAEKNGHKDEAEAIINEPVQVTPVIVPKSVPKVQGISFQKYGNIALSIRL